MICPYCKTVLLPEYEQCDICLAKRIEDIAKWENLSEFERQSGWVAYYTEAKLMGIK